MRATLKTKTLLPFRSRVPNSSVHNSSPQIFSSLKIDSSSSCYTSAYLECVLTLQERQPQQKKNLDHDNENKIAHKIKMKQKIVFNYIHFTLEPSPPPPSTKNRKPVSQEQNFGYASPFIKFLALASALIRLFIRLSQTTYYSRKSYMQIKLYRVGIICFVY